MKKKISKKDVTFYAIKGENNYWLQYKDFTMEVDMHQIVKNLKKSRTKIAKELRKDPKKLAKYVREIYTEWFVEDYNNKNYVDHTKKIVCNT